MKESMIVTREGFLAVFDEISNLTIAAVEEAIGRELSEDERDAAGRAVDRKILATAGAAEVSAK